jgi:DNA-directed RNA polymerase specialized sigma24 family protein
LQRAVIRMTYVEDLTDEQIARKLKKTKANVQVLRHRGLVQLSHILSQMGLKETRRKKHQLNKGRL